VIVVVLADGRGSRMPYPQCVLTSQPARNVLLT